MSDTIDLVAAACPICEADLPEGQAVYCSQTCRKRAKSRQTRARARFVRNAKRPLAIETVAAKLGIPVEEATRRAEHDIAAGRLLGWRHRDGRLAEVSTPRHAPKAAT